MAKALTRMQVEKRELIKGSIFFTLLFGIFYFAVNFTILAILAIISTDWLDSISAQLIFNSIITVLSAVIAMIPTTLFYFHRKDLEAELGRDILKIFSVLFLIFIIATSISNYAKIKTITKQQISGAADTLMEDISLDTFETSMRYIVNLGESSMNHNIKYIFISFSVKLFSLIIAYYVGKIIISHFLPERL